MANIKLSTTLFFLLFYLGFFLPSFSHGKLELMTDCELQAVTGMGSVDFSVIGTTTAVFHIDLHLELYGEIDSIKMGYYYKEDLTTRKFLPAYSFSEGSRDPQVVYKENTFDIIDLDTGEVIYADRPYFEYHGEKLPYTDDDYYMYKYQLMKEGFLPFPYYVDGAQGLNDIDAAVITGEKFSTARTRNTNNLDWDINIENLRYGKSPEEPMIIDGVTVMMKYDDINSPNKRLTDVIIGTNSMEGYMSADMNRFTGVVNAKMSHATRTPIINDVFIESFVETPVPVVLQRDSFIYMVDEFDARYDDPTDGELPSNPADPTDNNIHTGSFLRIGLDPTSPTYGYSLVMGYNEVFAASYVPKYEMIEDSIKDWWNK